MGVERKFITQTWRLQHLSLKRGGPSKRNWGYRGRWHRPGRGSCLLRWERLAAWNIIERSYKTQTVKGFGILKSVAKERKNGSWYLLNLYFYLLWIQTTLQCFSISILNPVKFNYLYVNLPGIHILLYCMYSIWWEENRPNYMKVKIIWKLRESFGYYIEWFPKIFEPY